MGNVVFEVVWQMVYQMSICRMGVIVDDGVVDMMGRVWGKKGLYVVDSSVMLSVSGVNFMIMMLVLVDWILRGLVKEMVG